MLGDWGFDEDLHGNVNDTGCQRAIADRMLEKFEEAPSFDRARSTHFSNRRASTRRMLAASTPRFAERVLSGAMPPTD